MLMSNLCMTEEFLLLQVACPICFEGHIVHRLRSLYPGPLNYLKVNGALVVRQERFTKFRKSQAAIETIAK